MLVASNGVPSSFAQGDSVTFGYSDPAYPSSAWTLKLAMFRALTPATLPAATANDDGSFTFSFTPTDTELLTPGKYIARLIFTGKTSGQKVSLPTFCIFVSPDLTQPLKPTPEMQQLAKLTGQSVGTIQSYSGGGISWSKFGLAQNRAEIDRLTVIVQAQLRELGLSTAGGSRTIAAGF